MDNIEFIIRSKPSKNKEIKFSIHLNKKSEEIPTSHIYEITDNIYSKKSIEKRINIEYSKN